MEAEVYQVNRVRFKGFALNKAREKANLSQSELAARLVALGADGEWYQRKIARMEARYENCVDADTFQLLNRALSAMSENSF